MGTSRNGDFVVRADHHLKEGTFDRWLELARADAREAVKEPGCRSFDILRASGSETHAMLWEVYDSEASWRWHMEQPYVKAFMKEAADLLADKVRLTFDMVSVGGS